MSHPPFVSVVMMLLIVGCRPADEIRTYRVPKEASRSPRATAIAEPTHRMLAAVVPLDDQAWFFKAVGTTEQMEQIAPQLKEFYGSLSVQNDDVSWQLPEGWQETQGNEMRLSTIQVPIGDESVELSVTRLPWTGDGPGGLLANVNRWRNQMSLPTIGPADLAECTQVLALADHAGTLVDLSGSFSGGMSAPLASNTSPHPAPADTRTHPPIEPAGLTFEAPSNWQALPIQPGGFRKAAFAVVQGTEKAEFTAMDFPKRATAMADPLANVNRWLAELGRAPVTPNELDQLSEEVTIDGQAATLFQLEGDATTERPEATLAAMVEKGDMVWFFKLRGDLKLVASQTDQFRAFVDSVQFGSSEEGEHGDN